MNKVWNVGSWRVDLQHGWLDRRNFITGRRKRHVQPMQNCPESPVQDPLFSAIESTFLSELIQTMPGRVRTEDADDIALRLESMLVACDLGPTLVMRLLDTRKDTYIWSEAYNLEEAAAATERPTLVEKAAMDVGAAIR